MSGQRRAANVLELEWGGRRYRRHPDSPHRNHRLYWMATIKPRTYLHRDIYEANYGPIPAGFHVHHENGDALDNRPENLVAVGSAEHAVEHYAGRIGRVYICDECGREFTSRKYTNDVRWCSPACKERWRRRAGVAYKKPKVIPFSEERLCDECGAPYEARKWWSRFCSPVCRGAAGRRRRREA